MSIKLTEKGKLSLAAFSNEQDTNDMIRGLIIDACGGEWDYYKFMENQYKVFSVLAELMPASMQAAIGGAFDGFANFRDTAMGDENAFVVPDNKLFKVLTVARGMVAERQRVDNSVISVPTEMKMINVYTELDEFLAGKVDWAGMNNRVMASFANHVGDLIYTAISGAYADLAAGVKHAGAFDADTLMGIIEQVQAYSGANEIAILGSKRSLRQVTDIAGYSDAEKQRFNNFGYYGTFSGTDLLEIPQAFKNSTSDLILSNSQLLIVPMGGKIVNVAFEGQPFVGMTDAIDRNDLQPQIMYGRRIGVAAMTAPEGQYGIYNITA